MNNSPLVSVVVPIRNEARSINECLTAVLNQDYPAEQIELVVVDGLSDDGTREILKRLSGLEKRITVIDNPRRIFPTGVNVGIRHAKGDLVLILGGHATLPLNYIRECVACLTKENADCVGGAMDSVGIGHESEGIALAMGSRFGVGGSGFRTQGPTHVAIPTDTVPFGLFRREVFQRVGLFNEAMVRHQDYELNYRLRRAGGKILLLPWLRVQYYVRSGLKALFKQYWQYGIWKGRFVCAYPKSLKPRHVIPPVFVGALAVGAVSCFAWNFGLVFTGLLLVAYLSFLFYAAAQLSVRKDWRLAPVVTIAIAFLHVSWGAGFWVGLARGRAPAHDQELPADGLSHQRV